MPAPSLLRTVRETFTSYGSSLPKASPCGGYPLTVINSNQLCDNNRLPLTAAGGAPADPRAAVICLPPLGGSAGLLAKGDPSDVCSLSRRANFEPVSASLQSGIRFFRHPTPAHPSDALACYLPKGRCTGLSCSAQVPEQVRFRLYAGGTTSATEELAAPVPGHAPFGPSLSAS